IVGRYHQRTAAIAPFVTNQLPAACHLQVRLLTRGGRTASFLQLRLDRADAIFLLHSESLGHYALSFDKNSKRTGIDHLRACRLRFVFLIAGKQHRCAPHNHDRSPSHPRPQSHCFFPRLLRLRSSPLRSFTASIFYWFEPGPEFEPTLPQFPRRFSRPSPA